MTERYVLSVCADEEEAELALAALINACPAKHHWWQLWRKRGCPDWTAPCSGPLSEIPGFD